MAELLPGNLAPTVAESSPAPPRPYRIRDSGRLDPDAAAWSRPLPPLLWRRLDDERRAAHERAVETYAEAAAKARELGARARQAAADSAEMSWATTCRMKNSPVPVAETATVSLFA